MCIIKFLNNLFKPIQVIQSSKLNISVDSKEALGFAIFAVAHIKEIPGNIPSVTGADKPVILGKMTS
jgi:anhydro-N-acetylmuramic acid kinase